MRKSLLLLVAIIFMVMSAPKTNALCPDGSNPVAVPFIYNGCNAVAYYCYYPVGTGYWCDLVEVEVQMPCGLNLVNDELFWDEAVQQMIDHLANNGSFPPCPLDNANITFRRDLCWKMENFPLPKTMKGTACNSNNECLWAYKICTDYSQTPPVVYKELVGHFSAITETICPDEFPVLPPIGLTIRDPWVTDCFRIWCNL